MNNLHLTLLLVISPLLLDLSVTKADGPAVTIKSGTLQGRYEHVKGKDTLVHTYLAVPFAAPPVGSLRLKPPKPETGWDGVRDATKQPHMCLQDRGILADFMKTTLIDAQLPDVSEDCLYLNIHTPAKPEENAKLPVMVWIHGGGFACGAAFLYDGSVLAAYENVVVVAIQYRLGILGFFSTGDEHSPGNIGLLDQVAALRWIQENIRSFGGDPNSVTIFGESAGGISVSLQLLSPLSVGLFHRAIAQSGTAQLELITNNDPRPLYQVLANVSGCDITNSKSLVRCVMQLSKDNVMDIFEKTKIINYGVTVDGVFLPKSVDEILQKQEFQKLPFITGMTNHEGGYLLPRGFAPPNWEKGMDRNEATLFLSTLNPKGKEEAAELMADEYFGTPGDREAVRDGWRELVGDVFFVIPAIKTANYHRDAGGPVYLYEFQQAPSMVQADRPKIVRSDHGDDIPFVLGACFANGDVKVLGTFKEEENKLCRTMMAYWANFARTGSPNGKGLVTWPQYGQKEEYMSIGLEQKASTQLKKRQFTFLTETLPEKLKERGPEVKTKSGTLRGRYEHVKGKDTLVHAYLSVPFAAPPVGSLRLKPPKPAAGWEGVRDATKQPDTCLQDTELLQAMLKNFSMDIKFSKTSEDCLYLNIHTPAKPTENAKLPVMVWIHGGGFTCGGASMFDGSPLAAYENVVVVSIQYRLGILGFFSTGDEHAPGNLGMMDQVEALRWVQENIHSFGGDPNSVTIFGESAGGVSVSLLLLSPMSAGLFHNAIAQSGTAEMNTVFQRDPAALSQMVANLSGCDPASSQKIVRCLMEKTEDDINHIHKQARILIFGLTVDGVFLPKSAGEIFQKQEFHKVPFITGVTNQEFGWLLPTYFAPPDWVDGIDRETVMPTIALFNPAPEDQWINELMADEYMGTSGDRIAVRDGWRELMGDVMFVIPALKTANYHRDAGVPVYLYEFQHPNSLMQKSRPAFVKSDHGDDIGFVFGNCFSEEGTLFAHRATFTEAENHLCRTMMSYWANFARTGNPNGEGLVAWPRYEPKGQKYLGIGLEQKPAERLKENRFVFLTETVPEKVKAHRQKERAEL